MSRLVHCSHPDIVQGSISSDVTVSGIVIQDNTIQNKCVRFLLPYQILHD